jgi:glycosyltransferase involved in cell wall biosynthesis
VEGKWEPMKYSAKDIEVFVLTCNRADFLEQTLRTICGQRASGFRLVVLDNDSTDHTSQVLDKFKHYRVEVYRSSRNLGHRGNFEKAQSLASAKWTMVFHDDDLMHPDYINALLNIINKHDRLSLVGTVVTVDKKPGLVWTTQAKKVRYFESVTDFAAALYSGFSFHFGSAIYRTELFKANRFQWETYGKVIDRPFLFDMACNGPVAVFTEPYVKYRCHEGQDSQSNVTGPFPDELIALHKRYFQLLGDNVFTRKGRIFVLNNYKLMRAEASRLDRIRLKDYLQNAVDAGATTSQALAWGSCLLPVVLTYDQARRLVSKAGRIRRSFNLRWRKDLLLLP